MGSDRQYYILDVVPHRDRHFRMLLLLFIWLRACMRTARYVTIATSEFPRARRAPSHLIRMRRAYVHAVSLSLHTGFISFHFVLGLASASCKVIHTVVVQWRRGLKVCWVNIVTNVRLL